MRLAATIVALVLVIAGVAILAYLLLAGRPAPPSDVGVDPTPGGVDPTPAGSAPSDEVVFVGAGDIAECPTQDDEATAAILDEIVAEHPDAVVFTAGDNAYQDGSYEEFLECYDPSWGRHKDRTRPAVGNHEFKQTQAEGYHRYWGDVGGPFDLYYYSFDLSDDWHVVVLNSECHRVGCEFGSEDGEQVEWLERDLVESAAECTIAIWHHPRWSSGRYGNDPELGTLWQVLYDHAAEIVINGHEHIYERFEPMAPDGNLDRAGGIRQFTVGTGGANLRGFPDIAPNSAARGSEHGVLELRLADGRYRWEFLPVQGASFSDSGTGSCH